MNTTTKKANYFLFFVAYLFYTITLNAQNLLVNPGMENNTGWTIENQGSSNPAAYTFNYTTSKPNEGSGGCLRITSAVATNILFYQKLTLIAGKTYSVDAAVKTNNVASFWLELFLSTSAPVAGADYNPSGGLVRGLSSWYGCGPNLDGLMSVVACRGSNTFIVPGTAGSSVSVYFAIKTGSMSTTFPETMQVLIDNPIVYEYDDSKLQSSAEGTLNQSGLTISNISPLITYNNLREGLRALRTSSVSIVWASTQVALTTEEMAATITSNAQVKVAGTSTTNFYNLTLRDVSSANSIVSTSIGSLDAANSVLNNIPNNVRVAQLLSALTLSPYATAKIMSGEIDVEGTNTITSGMTIRVTAENGATKTYTISLGSPMTITSASNLNTTVTSINNTIYNISGNSAVHITSSANPLSGSCINLTSDNVWLYFDNIKPQVINDKYLAQVLINGSASVPGNNMRLVRYAQGAVIISQSSAYQPLTIYSGANLTGTQMKLNQYTYYRPYELGAMNDNITSFVLKKGYMATFAADSMGTGLSRNYVADESDKTINELEIGLKGQVSFIRVFPWIWGTKKGWAGGSQVSSDILNCSWTYDWNNVATSSLNVEYIPMRHGKWWNAYSNINNKLGSTAALGFNEPNSADQANMTVAEAVAAWPNLLTSGLRVGSPCPTDGGSAWLYDFIDQCDALNYRVDFVALHFYRCGQTTANFYNFMKAIHDRTKRPVWVTEWNNGANWTTCADPTYAQQAETVEKWIHMMDTCSFVERYSIYEWVEDTRKIFLSGNILTPAGEAYQKKISPMYLNPQKIYRPPFKDALAPTVPTLTISNITTNSCVLSWLASTDNGAVAGYQIFRDGVAIATSTSTTYTATGLTQGTSYSFSVKAYDTFSNYSAESNVVGVTMFAVPSNGNIYKIVAKHSGKAFTIRGASTANSAYLTQNVYNADAHQNFKVVANGSYFNIYPQHVTGKVLDVSGSSTANDANVLQYTYGSTKANQQWTFVNVSGPYYQIKNRNSGKCLYVVGASTADDVQVKQYTCNTSSDNQLFTFSTSLLKSAKAMSEIADGNSEIRLYPNPFTSNLKINSNPENVLVIKVLNAQGQIIKIIDKITNEIDMGADLSSGIYMVVVTTHTGNKTYKVIKK